MTSDGLALQTSNRARAASAAAGPDFGPRPAPSDAAATPLWRRRSWTLGATPTGGLGRAALPPADPAAPVCAERAGAPPPREAVSAVREGALWWPTPRRDAIPAARLLIDPGGARARLSALFAAAADAGRPYDAWVPAAKRGRGWVHRLSQRFAARPLEALNRVEPAALELLAADPATPGAVWFGWSGRVFQPLDPIAGADAGLRPGPPAPAAPPGARFLDPWSGVEAPWAEAIDAARFFAERAHARARPIVTVGLSPWKRRNVEPFLSGPAGPPRHRRTLRAARRLAHRTGAEIALWGPSRPAADALRRDGFRVLLLEDGFIRSVGLGVEHERPLSLVAARRALHFETDRDTDFAALLARTKPDAALRARAEALLDDLRAAGVTKYMDLAPAGAADAAGADPEAGAPPPGRTRVLVVGQVERDASLRFGGGYPGGNVELLRRARARWPDAFLLYKPHPDVVSGLRAEPSAEAIAALADAVAPRLGALEAIDWADVVETMTSQLGFEAVLRGKRVVCHGRPFYAGLGLTEDLAPRSGPPAPRQTPETLAATALLVYPQYLCAETRTPCPPDIALASLARLRARPRSPWAQAWKRGLARVLNRLP